MGPNWRALLAATNYRLRALRMSAGVSRRAISSYSARENEPFSRQRQYAKRAFRKDLTDALKASGIHYDHDLL